MKALFYRLLLLTGWLVGLGLPASAQTIANGNFETWATRGTAEAPANWLTTDDLFTALDPGYTYNTGTVTKSTDAHGGSFAAKLTNIAFSDNKGNSVVQQGIMILGTKLGGHVTYGNLPIGGAPCTTRPAQFQFYYKLTGPATDSAIATLLLTKTGAAGTKPTLVGGGTITLAPTTGSGYVGVSATIPYKLSDTPDSVRIQFISATVASPAAGSTLLIDDVALVGTALAVRADASTQAQLTVWPNPSPAGRFQLSAPDQPALASAPYLVFDLMGRVVAQQPALAVPSPTRELDLSRLSTGIYMLRLDAKQGALVRQLVVE